MNNYEFITRLALVLGGIGGICLAALDAIADVKISPFMQFALLLFSGIQLVNLGLQD